MSAIVFSLFRGQALTKSIRDHLDYEIGAIEFHRFPDREVLVEINSSVKDRIVIFVGSLVRPDSKMLSLIYAAETARDLGATKIIFVSPYLPYMRQDKIFAQGQGVTSEYFARLITRYFDGLVTIDPHLHRWKSLSQIYDIPTRVGHAASQIGTWIQSNTKSPLIIGPDQESEQWVREVALAANAPYVILEKKRSGDRDVAVHLPDVSEYRDHIPVLVDDIISTGSTLIRTVEQLISIGSKPPICIGIHGVFAGKAYQNLINAGASQIITCNTIAHHANRIDINADCISALKALITVDLPSRN